jgi:hypothetical protein
MNDVFDLKRWLLYTSKYWSEHKKRFLLSLCGIGGLMILWYSFVVFIAGDSPIGVNIQSLTYYAGLFITGCLFASTIFSGLGNSTKATHFLLIPASAFEKLLTALLFGIILFFIGYTLVYYAVDITMVKISNSVEETMALHHHIKASPPADIANVFVSPDGGDNFYIYFLLGYFAVQSLFLLGSVYFSKNGIIKTTVSVLVVFLFLMFFVHKLMHLFVPQGEFFEPFSVYRIFNAHKGEVAVLLPDWLNTPLLFLVKYSVAPVCWLVTYYRLKEKEVNA